ncbi:MAG: type III secretion system chaperone, partial [Victivallales bacterium]|nr:type III secretion system chaperone [Victivallales bacterium]
ENAGVAVYRDLLTGSLFGKDTGGGYFTMEGESNTVIYNCMFDFATAAADPENFVETLENILQLVDIWADRISGNLGKEDSEGKNDGDTAVIPNHPSTLFFRP